MSVESVMPSNHLVFCHQLLLLPSVFPGIRVFSNEFALHTRWPKYWNFSFSVNPSNDYSGLISSRIDWFDLLAVQGTLKSLLQYRSFFIVQLSHLYMTTGKTIALTRWTFVGKVMSLLFNMLSGFVSAMQETWVRFLGGENLLEKEMATHSSVLAWRIPWTEEPAGCCLWGRKNQTRQQLNHHDGKLG